LIQMKKKFFLKKSLIYKHPLFPVLAYVLERCEQATLNSSLLTTKDDCHTSSFESNLKIFLSKNHDLLTINRDNNDSSLIIDEFYIDAMQVLRIHLLELEKVNDLCHDFCQRYIACLKVKLNANNIFTDDEDEDFESNSDEDCESIEDDFTFNQQELISTNDLNSICNQYRTHFDGQTSLSQIISTGSSSRIDSSSFEFDTKQRKQSTIISSSKRSILPKSATSIMRSWLFQHIGHPYPTEDEKRTISRKTNLSLLQVNNWFINARRRILQPMLETSNPDLITTKKKKRYDTTLDEHRSSRQMSNINRYWPANLARFDKNKK